MVSVSQDEQKSVVADLYVFALLYSNGLKDVLVFMRNTKYPVLTVEELCRLPAPVLKSPQTSKALIQNILFYYLTQRVENNNYYVPHKSHMYIYS